jgi:hypothetical protein
VYGGEGWEMIIATTGKAVRKTDSSKSGKLKIRKVGKLESRPYYERNITGNAEKSS